MCFNEVQKDASYKKHAAVLRRCMLDSGEETTRAFRLVVLQLLAWNKKSHKLARVLALLKLFFENCVSGSYSLKPTPEETKESVTLKSRVISLAKELLSVACQVCSAANYLVKVRASTVMRILCFSPSLPVGIVFETCGHTEFIKDGKMSQELEAACLTLLRGMANLKAVAIKLAPCFEREGSRTSAWTGELLRIMGVCRTVAYRVAAVKSVGVSDYTLPYLLMKSRDISPDVRAAVYVKLSDERVELQTLLIKDRYDILLNGLMDHKEFVRCACAQYLRLNLGWLQEEEAKIARYRKFKSDAAEMTESDSLPLKPSSVS